MSYEVSLLVFAMVLFFLDLTLLSKSRNKGEQKRRIGFCAALLGFVLIVVSYALLLQAFVSNNFSFSSVYSYSSSGLPLLSKIYASWAGAAGSMLFLTFLLGVIYVGLRFRILRRPDDFSIATGQVFCIILIVFLMVCLVRDPFERLVITPFEGRGLNPQLQTLWMTIHPPIVFSAYAFVLLAYSSILASMRTKRELNDLRIFRGSTYVAWLLLTTGIVLGGVWAYEVLGWGGYWAWDPVETASLLPWLFLTAYFHVGQLSKHKKSFTRESMVFMTFTSLVFLTALTRGGFTQSVHSYAMSPVGPIMLVFGVAMVAYFFYLGRKRRQSFFSLETDRASLTSRSTYVGFWALMLIALVCFVGLAFPDFAYNFWTFPFVIVFVAALVGCSLDYRTRLARLVLLVMGALIIGIALMMNGLSGINPLAAIAFPLLALALSTTFYRLVRTLLQKSFSLFGRELLHFGIIVLLLGVFISAGTKTMSPSVVATPNSPTDMSPLTTELMQFTFNKASGIVYNEQLNATIPEHSSVEIDAKIQYLGKTYYGSVTADFYPNYGLVLRPLIISTEVGDVYLHLDYSDSLSNALIQALMGHNATLDSVQLSAQISPLIYLVWIGATIMVVGMSAQFIVFLISGYEKKKLWDGLAVAN